MPSLPLDSQKHSLRLTHDCQPDPKGGIMEHEKERERNVPCTNSKCEYWDMIMSQWCSASNYAGDPAVIWCEDYKPSSEVVD